ncbi:MAG: hypothetical protein KBG20_22620 [Caldilineaceae bacterium]|nr:hypothetical protein [Caldilineaceae bacterium]MBP8107968.1 hypothetical protein [Caldilineaceae bacterium]MBP8123867.1 hypothetical protein [Caldilineaceae bacterium]MBP9075120.1 hypothetical protein [Caldilineaceae bacterium]
MTLLPVLIVLVSTVLHASWNLMAHARRTDPLLLLRSAVVTLVVALIPLLVVEWLATPMPGMVWGLLVLTGIFQAIYMLGLTAGYQVGDFSVVYPVARALPVLILAFVDLGRGHAPSPLGWLGILLVTVGCLVLPLERLGKLDPARYFNRTGMWILLTAIGTTGYSTVDKLAVDMLPQGLPSAIRYGAWETIFMVPFLLVLLPKFGGIALKKGSAAQWRQAALAALFIASAYWMILWAFQLSPYTSYIVALRQFSIVLGVIAAAILFKEPAPRLRIGASLVIAAGVICIGFA